MIFLRRGQFHILIFNLVYLVLSLFIFLSRKNYEFIMYVGVIIILLFVIILTNKRVYYPNVVLWLLSLWGVLHMLGGGLLLKNGTMRLYELILIPISSEYSVFKYDQFVHIIGFGVATLLMYVLLGSYLPKKITKWTSIGIVVIMAGLGVGALNEIVEFIATTLVPETGVGGYTNTSLDLVSDLFGAVFTFIYIKIKKGKI